MLVSFVGSWGMYIHADMPGSGTLLLALDGVPVGLVVEADTCGGWLRRYDTRGLVCDTLVGTVVESGAPGPRPTGSVANLADWDPTAAETAHVEHRRRVAACPIVRVEGKVDFVGDTATDPDWMISQRLAAVRIRHGLPIDVSVAHDTGGMVASVLERLAAQLRDGSMVAVNLGQTRTSDRFPLPDGRWQFQPTGRMSLSVDYESPDVVRSHETAKADWARRHPELIAEHVRSLTEGEARIVEEMGTAAALRVRSAEARCRLPRRP
jgi:hypothetical protein